MFALLRRAATRATPRTVVHPPILPRPVRVPYARTKTTAARASTCPLCAAPLPPTLSPTCTSCTALLPPPSPSASHFDLFGVPASFDIDQRELKRAYLRWQQTVHPDLYSGKGDQLKWAQAWSMRVNDAFRCLEGDKSRGEYLLSLATVTIGETDAVTDPELLMTIMETREALDEATSEEEVQAIREQNKVNIVTTIKDLSGAFKESPPDLETAKNLVIQLRYLENVDGVCREWSPGKRVEIQH